MTTNESRPAGENRAARSKVEEPQVEGSSPDRRIPIARARAYAPTGRRRLYVAVVDDCPHCHAAHLHRGERWHDLVDVVKNGSCGRSYVLHLSGLQLAEAVSA